MTPLTLFDQPISIPRAFVLLFEGDATAALVLSAIVKEEVFNRAQGGEHPWPRGEWWWARNCCLTLEQAEEIVSRIIEVSDTGEGFLVSDGKNFSVDFPALERACASASASEVYLASCVSTKTYPTHEPTIAKRELPAKTSAKPASSERSEGVVTTDEGDSPKGDEEPTGDEGPGAGAKPSHARVKGPGKSSLAGDGGEEPRTVTNSLPGEVKETEKGGIKGGREYEGGGPSRGGGAEPSGGGSRSVFPSLELDDLIPQKPKTPDPDFDPFEEKHGQTSDAFTAGSGIAGRASSQAPTSPPKKPQQGALGGPFHPAAQKPKPTDPQAMASEDPYFKMRANQIIREHPYPERCHETYVLAEMEKLTHAEFLDLVAASHIFLPRWVTMVKNGRGKYIPSFSRFLSEGKWKEFIPEEESAEDTQESAETPEGTQSSAKEMADDLMKGVFDL